ncbi:MarC family protein [Paraburkholderia sp. Ac-20347]|uniref:MarC family protein n=1 Tax=Paraburkholderia sp. Ac-20347 TaxID=2703892 RepID=UPI0019801DD7|nr:MarC family protein [Paraburkholderia sp. Ac-20347]MBN3809903.1 MarC family protein [Paraburkholderia sp. Ac-20347]
MAIDFTFSMKVFSSLFAIMNPIANIPVFLSLTEGMADGKKRAVAATTFIGVTIGCVISVTVGETILNVFGVSIEDFRLAGGLLVLLIALDMVHGSPSAQHTPQRREVGESGYDQDVAIFPLTTPLLVGPGTIATLVVFGHAAASNGEFGSLAIGLVVFLALLAIALFSAPYLGRFLSAKVTAIARRLMGMILAAIAVEMMAASLTTIFKGLVH